MDRVALDKDILFLSVGGSDESTSYIYDFKLATP
jgi:hypothetical protein